MTAYNSNFMTIEHGAPGKRKEYVYSFEPRVGAGEGRKRLVGMHPQAKAGLGLVSLPDWGVATRDGADRHRHSIQKLTQTNRPGRAVPPAHPLLSSPRLMSAQSDVTINHVVLSPSLILTIVFFALLQLAVLLAPAQYVLDYAAFAAPYVAEYQRQSGLQPTRASVANGVRWCLLAPLVLPHLVETFACARPLLRRFNTSRAVVRWTYVSRQAPWSESGVASKRGASGAELTGTDVCVAVGSTP